MKIIPRYLKQNNHVLYRKRSSYTAKKIWRKHEVNVMEKNVWLLKNEEEFLLKILWDPVSKICS